MYVRRAACWLLPLGLRLWLAMVCGLNIHDANFFTAQITATACFASTELVYFMDVWPSAGFQCSLYVLVNCLELEDLQLCQMRIFTNDIFREGATLMSCTKSESLLTTCTMSRIPLPVAIPKDSSQLFKLHRTHCWLTHASAIVFAYTLQREIQCRCL